MIEAIPRKKSKPDSGEDTDVYEGFLPLWDRKWLFQEEAWIFDKGIGQDPFFRVMDENAKAYQRKVKAKKRRQALEASQTKKPSHRYPTSNKERKTKVVNHGKDEIELSIPDSTSNWQDSNRSGDEKHDNEEDDLRRAIDMSQSLRRDALLSHSRSNSESSHAIFMASQNAQDQDDDLRSVFEAIAMSKAGVPNTSRSVDLDLTQSDSATSKNVNTVWVVNVGMRGWTGEHIVDDIMNFVKTVKFLPTMVHCFRQPIALREIHEGVGNKRFHGRVRCVIKIAPDVVGDEYKTAANGWQEGKNWNGYPIIEVRQLFVHVILKQSCEGRPWRVFTDETYLAETAKLLGALHMGVVLVNKVTNTQALLCDQKKNRWRN